MSRVRHLKKQPGTIVTDGSTQLVHALLAHDLVDELNLLLYPVMLRSGKRLFEVWSGCANASRALGVERLR